MSFLALINLTLLVLAVSAIMSSVLVFVSIPNLTARQYRFNPPHSDAVCNSRGDCRDYSVDLFVDNSSTRAIGVGKDTRSLLHCSSTFEAKTFPGGWRSRSTYLNKKSGGACPCIAYCRQDLRDCTGNPTAFRGWTILLPETSSPEGCACENAILPQLEKPTCGPSSRGQSLVLAYLQNSPSCATDATPQEWQIWNAADLRWDRDSSIALRCHTEESVVCMACHIECLQRRPNGCMPAWPPRCFSEATVTCSFECEGGFEVTMIMPCGPTHVQALRQTLRDEEPQER